MTHFSASPSTIESLPNDLLIEILAKVAAYSIKDLVHVKLANKEFLKASNHNYIFQHASTGNFRTLRWNIDPEFWSFMGKCVNNGNPEALYRSGMLEFFSQCREANGMKYLKFSAQKDYLEACYVYGIILYTKNLEDEGVKFLKICEEKLGFKMAHCCQRVKEFVYYLWIRNKISLPKKDSSSDWRGSKSVVKNCCKKNKKLRRIGWNWIYDDYYGERTCEACKWTEEVLKFCNMISRENQRSERRESGDILLGPF